MTITIGHADPAWLNPVITIAAVILSGALSAILSLKIAQRSERLQRRDSQLANCYRIIFRIRKMTDVIFRLEREMNSAKSKTKFSNENEFLWISCLTTKGYRSDQQDFSPEELSTLSCLKDVELLDTVLKIEHVYISVPLIIESIGALQASVNELGLDTSVKGQKPLVGMNHHFVASLRDAVANVETLIRTMSETSKLPLNGLGEKLQNHFGFEDFIALDPPEA